MLYMDLEDPSICCCAISNGKAQLLNVAKYKPVFARESKVWVGRMLLCVYVCIYVCYGGRQNIYSMKSAKGK
jgi:hypothetical protein